MPKNSLIKNAERFTGFGDIYDKTRPSMPFYPVKLVSKYLNRCPKIVVDLGCGTGLSSIVWIGNSEKIIGVEPSIDMINIAKHKETESLSFIQGYSHMTGIDDETADVVQCSQSFHWMEPSSTLAEVNRILKKGGIFIVVDYEVVPVVNWRYEKVYTELRDKMLIIERDFPEIGENIIRYEKSRHLENIKNSGYFSYCREVFFTNTESFSKERFHNWALSQGGIQTILKKRPELIKDILTKYNDTIDSEFFSDGIEVDFCYKIRLGIK